MENEKDKAAKNKLKAQVFDALADNNPIDLPQSLVANEINALRQQAMQQYGQLSDKIDVQSLLPDELFKKQAERRTLLGLLVAEVVAKENVKADKALVRKQVEVLAASYEEPEAVINYYYSNEQMMANIEASVLEEQVVEHLLDVADVVEQSVSYQELIKPLDAEQV